MLIRFFFLGNLVGRPLTLEAADLVGYRPVYPFEGGLPLLLESPGGLFASYITPVLEPADYERLDAYQGVEEGLYLRHEALIRCAAEGERTAYVYLPSEKARRQLG